ncbi:hypothetical protein J6590_055521 [Homalodisca vitripennis]|nr:hypothetical protein J6590_055521 [Homalodisca vitripennis]
MTASRDLTIKVMMTAVETIFRVWVQRDGMVCNMTLSMPSLTHDNFDRSDHKGNDDLCWNFLSDLGLERWNDMFRDVGEKTVSVQSECVMSYLSKPRQAEACSAPPVTTHTPQEQAPNPRPEACTVLNTSNIIGESVPKTTSFSSKGPIKN